jgi:P pilus assembly chaperone PapD
MKIQKYLTSALVLISISQLCAAEQVTFKNDTALPITIEYGKNKGNGRYASNEKTDPIAPFSEVTLNLDLNANDMFHARLVPSTARGKLSKGKSTYAILLDGQALRIS